uniref:Uncharacterized protein n=1 Tax=Anguilla anguilla TaxID=7936 RepID=A0A0E9UMB3_ANGAN
MEAQELILNRTELSEQSYWILHFGPISDI